MKLQFRKTSILVQIQEGPWGEVSPLPGRSKETLHQALLQLQEHNWVSNVKDLESLCLFPSVHFGLESALLPPPPPIPFTESALFMGTPAEILSQADARQKEGFRSAKLKVSQLTFSEADQIINSLSSRFYLRIDVNQAWNTEEALRFFSKYPTTLFDYVEEPFQTPEDLPYFSHPLAIDESFPNSLSLPDLEQLPTLRALIYKPTLQGGLAIARPLYAWTQKRGLQFILSSSFESQLGLSHIISIARHLDVNMPPLGLGTRHFNRPTEITNPTRRFPKYQ